MIGIGTCKVKVENIGRDTGYIKEVIYLSKEGPFTVQVGSFRGFSNAKRLKMGLELKYSEVYISETEIDGSTFYRVRIGKFQTKDEVRHLSEILANEGYSVFITRYDERM